MRRMKDIAKVDLPREKLEKYGTRRLADHELLAIVLGSGTKGLNVVALAKRVLKRLRSGDRTLDGLLAEKGLGKAKALQIIATVELGRRLQENGKQEILSAEDVWKQCADIRESKREHFVAFYLDTQGRVIERRVVSIGTLDASLVHPREVFEPAVTLHAASVIVAHNHPSGNLEPSEEDIEVTHRLVHAGKILGIGLSDHVVVMRDGWNSIKTDHL